MRALKISLKAVLATPVQDSPTVEVTGADGVVLTIPTQTRVVCSTSSVDRYGDVILQEGWQLATFQANPVIPFAHDYTQPPVGRAIEVGLQEHLGRVCLVALVQWDTSLQKGLETARQFHQGFLSAMSVGFRMLEWVRRADLPEDNSHHAAKGYLVRTAELMEVSVAPVPVLQDALAIRSLLEAEATLSPSDLPDLILATLQGDLRVRNEIRKLSRPLVLAPVPFVLPPVPEPGEAEDPTITALATLLSEDIHG